MFRGHWREINKIDALFIICFCYLFLCVLLTNGVIGYPLFDFDAPKWPDISS